MKKIFLLVFVFLYSSLAFSALTNEQRAVLSNELTTGCRCKGVHIRYTYPKVECVKLVQSPLQCETECAKLSRYLKRWNLGNSESACRWNH